MNVLFFVVCVCVVYVALLPTVVRGGDGSANLYVRSGYFGIHQCTAPMCADYSVLVQGDAGNAPYARSVQVDVARDAVYWIYLDLTQSPQPWIGAARLSTGRPLNTSRSDYVWIQRSSQDQYLAFDEVSGLLYVLASSNDIYALNPDTLQFTHVAQLSFSSYGMFFNAGYLYFTSYGSCTPQPCPCAYSLRLDGKSTDAMKLACAPDVPLPWQPAIVGMTSDRIFIGDPNDSYMVILDLMSGKLLGRWDYGSLGGYVSTLTIDQTSNTAFLCGSSGSYSVFVAVMNLTSNTKIATVSGGMDTCMGGYLTGQPRGGNVPIVREISPAAVPQTFSQTILVSGSNFVNSKDLQCRFGKAVVTKAVFHMDSVIECTVPQCAVPGQAMVQVSNDGLLWSRDQVFIEYTPAV
eukprot:ANDGO_01740.mRNA.1 hypothetical protein